MIRDLGKITADLVRNLDEKMSEVVLGEPHFSSVFRKYPFRRENFRPVLQARPLEGDNAGKPAFIAL
jgi:hypothetical protein